MTAHRRATLALFLIFALGAAAGALAALHLVDAGIKRHVARQEQAIEQIQRARALNQECMDALNTVWNKIEAGRLEEQRQREAD